MKDFFNYAIKLSSEIQIRVLDILILILVLFLTSFVLKILRRVTTKNLSDETKVKFIMIFAYAKWLIYVGILLMTLDTVGVNVNAILAGSAALMIGVGLALRTFFQDIISGVFILIDRTLSVGDIIEIDGQIGQVEKINLRTTKAVTIDKKVLFIPNHRYLTQTLLNWTENGSETRENLSVGVAYGSDVNKVKNLLMQVANEHPKVLKDPPPVVLFTNFADSALEFKLVFTLAESFKGGGPKSDMRFEIDRLFRKHDITIPFPRRDIHQIPSGEIK